MRRASRRGSQSRSRRLFTGLVSPRGGKFLEDNVIDAPLLESAWSGLEGSETRPLRVEQGGGAVGIKRMRWMNPGEGIFIISPFMATQQEARSLGDGLKGEMRRTTMVLTAARSRDACVPKARLTLELNNTGVWHRAWVRPQNGDSPGGTGQASTQPAPSLAWGQRSSKRERSPPLPPAKPPWDLDLAVALFIAAGAAGPGGVASCSAEPGRPG